MEVTNGVDIATAALEACLAGDTGALLELMQATDCTWGTQRAALVAAVAIEGGFKGVRDWFLALPQVPGALFGNRGSVAEAAAPTGGEHGVRPVAAHPGLLHADCVVATIQALAPAGDLELPDASLRLASKAIAEGRVELLRVAVQALWVTSGGARYTLTMGDVVLDDALRHDALPSLRYLVEEAPVPFRPSGDRWRHCIVRCAELGHVDTLVYLLSKDIPFEFHASDFVRAMCNQRVDVVRALCNAPPHFNVDPGACDNAALLHACRVGDCATLRYLLEEVGPRRGVALSRSCEFPVRSAINSLFADAPLYVCRKADVALLPGLRAVLAQADKYAYGKKERRARVHRLRRRALAIVDARLAWQARGPLLVLAQGVRVGRVKQRSECGEEPEAKKSG